MYIYMYRSCVLTPDGGFYMSTRYDEFETSKQQLFCVRFEFGAEKLLKGDTCILRGSTKCRFGDRLMYHMRNSVLSRNTRMSL